MALDISPPLSLSFVGTHNYFCVKCNLTSLATDKFTRGSSCTACRKLGSTIAMVEGLLLSMFCMQNFLGYVADGHLLSSWFHSPNARWQQPHKASKNDDYHRQLSIDECQLLLSNGQLRLFLSRYAVEYIPLGGGFWEPTEIRNDRQVLSRIRHLRTLATLPACDEIQRATKG